MIGSFVGINNSIKNTLIDVWTFSTIVFLNLLYKSLFPKNIEKLFIAIIVILTAIFSYILFTAESKDTHNLAKIPVSIVFISLSLAYFFRLLNKMPTTHIHHLPMFWINTGILIFYAGTIMIFIFSDYLVNVLKDSLMVYWSFYNSLNILSHVLIAMGLWQVTRKVKSL